MCSVSYKSISNILLIQLKIKNYQNEMDKNNYYKKDIKEIMHTIVNLF